jgi:hypothetical protein
MRHCVIAIALIGALSLPLAGAGVRLGTHAIRGVVKALSATALVITPSGRKADELVFVVNSSTDHEGLLRIGSPVSIRYVTRGKALVATAITADRGPDLAPQSGQR